MTEPFNRSRKFIIFIDLVFFLISFIGVSIQTSLYNNQAFAKPSLSNALITQRESEIDEIVFILEKSPLWTRLEKDSDEEKAILAALEKISQHNIEVIREAAKKYLKNNSRNLYEVIGTESRIFILNRYLFKVPENAPFNIGTFGGWEGVPVHNKEINWLWPLASKLDGQLYIEGRYEGYSGPPYLAMAEFDYFYRTYGLRK